MNSGPPTKRRKLHENESVPPHSENRHNKQAAKKRKDADGDTVMTNAAPNDTDEKQIAPKANPEKNTSSPQMTQPAVVQGDPFSSMFPQGPGGANDDEGFMMFSQQGGPMLEPHDAGVGGPSHNLKTELDVHSLAGSNGMDTSQIKTASLDTDTLFEKTKVQCELVWKMTGTLHNRYKKDMAAKDADWQKRLDDLVTNHQDELTVARKEHEQFVKELAGEHKRTLQEQKVETEKRLRIVTVKNDELQKRLDDRDETISKLREDKSVLERNYGELSSAYEALKTRFEGAKALFLGGDPASVLPATPASSDGNPSKGPKAKKRRLSEI